MAVTFQTLFFPAYAGPFPRPDLAQLSSSFPFTDTPIPLTAKLPPLTLWRRRRRPGAHRLRAKPPRLQLQHLHGTTQQELTERQEIPTAEGVRGQELPRRSPFTSRVTALPPPLSAAAAAILPGALTAPLRPPGGRGDVTAVRGDAIARVAARAHGGRRWRRAQPRGPAGAGAARGPGGGERRGAAAGGAARPRRVSAGPGHCGKRGGGPGGSERPRPPGAP